MTKRTNTKFYIVMGKGDDGRLTAIYRDMSYSFDAGHGFIFAKRDAAQKLARSYRWCSATVYSLQGVHYDIKKFAGHKLAKEAAERMFNP